MIILWLSVKRENEYDADINGIISKWSSIIFFLLILDDIWWCFYIFFLQYLDRFTTLLKIIQDFFLKSEYID